MKKQISLIITLAIEALLLILVLIVLIVGVLGIFLPILPGILLLGAGVAIYSLMVKGDYGILTPKVNRHVLKIRGKILELKITKKIMGVVKKIQKRKQTKTNEQILKYGLILFSFNIVLVFAFLFGFISLSILGALFNLQGAMIAFVPLLVVFLFAGSSAIVWYRFGQILGNHFKKRKSLNSALVVLISVLPLLAVLILFSGIISAVGGFNNEILAVAFLGLLLMSILSAVFELLVVNLGVITPTK